MQTHFSEQATNTTQERAENEQEQRPEQNLEAACQQQSWTCLINQVEALLQIEKLVTSLLLTPPQAAEQEVSEEMGLAEPQLQLDSPKKTTMSLNQQQKAATTVNTCGGKSLKLRELASKLQEANAGSLTQAVDVTEQCKQVFQLLQNLPFVHVSNCLPDSNISLINPKSISRSTAKDGAAQCFLVIQESQTASVSSDSPKLTLKTISDFVKESKYGSYLRLMSSIDKGDETTSASVADEVKITQGRFFAEAHTFALAVQALIASDPKLSNLTSSYLEQAMSVSAPVFDPLKAAQRLNSYQYQSQPMGGPEMVDLAATNSKLGGGGINDQELLRHNIAQMYQYYNQLIFRQGQQNRYQTGYQTGNSGYQRESSAAEGHRTVTYASQEDQRQFNSSGQTDASASRSHSMSMRRYQTGADGSQTRLGDSVTMPAGGPPDAGRADRSRSRSTARNNNTSASENLLVSLDEAVLPPQITKVRPLETAVDNSISDINETTMRASEGQVTTARQPASADQDSVEAAAQGPQSNKLLSKSAPILYAGQHPEISIRYTKREILQIFKGLGRFQSPLDQHHFYEIEIEKVGGLLKDKLLLNKPDVVLEHLKTEKAIPLTSNARIQRTLFSTVKRYYDSVSGEAPPSYQSHSVQY